MIALTIARNLRKRRKALGLTQEHVAYAARMDRTTYQLMESAKSDRATNSLLNPKLFNLYRVANVLGLSMAQLLGEAPLPPAPTSSEGSLALRPRAS